MEKVRQSRLASVEPVLRRANERLGFKAHNDVSQGRAEGEGESVLQVQRC